jgi:hypothetical protein
MTPELRVLTVRQPWAWAIIHGGKDVENRTRNLAGDYRGLIAIHAALEPDREPMLTRGGPALSRAQITAVNDGRAAWRPAPWDADKGHIIGIANLWAVHQDRDNGNCCPHRPSGGPGGSPWAEPSTWHLCLNNPRPLRSPVPLTGGLGLRRLTPALAEAVLLQVALPCPECAAGKHRNCVGTTWSNDLDRLVPCPCTDTHTQPKEIQ